MIRFKIDNESTELLDRISNIYNFKRDTITGRIALALSINKGKFFHDNENGLPQNGREYTPTSNIFGRLVNDTDNFVLYKTIFDQHYAKELSENDFIKLYKLHLRDGLDLWINELEKGDITKGEPSRCCRRPRCGEHAARGLCDRCGQALDRRRGGLSAVAWTLGGVAGAIAALAMLIAHSTSAVVVGLAVAPVVGVVAHRALIARTIKQLRPTLATTVGELPLPERNFEEFPAASRPSGGTSAGARLM